MSDFNSQVYHIFNQDGKLTQIEYALEAVNNSFQIVSVASDEFIVNVSRKLTVPMLQEDTFSSVFKIIDNIYCNITGLPADIDFVISKARDLASSKEYTLGLGQNTIKCRDLQNITQSTGLLTPDIFVRSLADKFQTYIQRSGERIPAFAAMVFGFEKDKTKLYYTDLSAIELPCYAMCAGEDYHKMITFLEKNYTQTLDKDQLIKVAVGALLQSIGKEAEHTEIEISVFSKAGLEYLLSQEIDGYLQAIAENE